MDFLKTKHFPNKEYGAIPELIDSYNKKEEEKKKQNESSGCFITSAVCRTFGKPDDCYELTQFRAFRDKWLIQQPDGRALIKEYYDVAPKIVRRIDADADSKSIYQKIWDTYLKPCLALIERQEYADCMARYTTMVTNLKQAYLMKNV